jgi:hypothetical protein
MLVPFLSGITSRWVHWKEMNEIAKNKKIWSAFILGI